MTENLKPMHALGPAENVGNFKDGISIAPSGTPPGDSHRSGLNSAASRPQKAGSLPIVWIGIKMLVPLAILEIDIRECLPN